MRTGFVQEIGTMTNKPHPHELDRFRVAILNDAHLRATLYAFDQDDAFSARAAAIAAELGFRLSTEDVNAALRNDPVGLIRWSGTPIFADVPDPGWLPVNIAIQNGQPCLDWAYFGCIPLDDPFFESSVWRAFLLPLNRLVRCRTRLADLAQAMRAHAGLAPSGFIFHMSRCGSTLVSQMLAADPRNIVISEAPPIDSAVQIDRASGARGTILAAVISAFGRKRAENQSRYFIKLDSWHARALPLFRKAFPEVPWVFLYREPADVLASQILQPGMHVVPNLVPPALFGLDVADQFPLERHCAAVVGKICEAVLESYSEGGGLLVNYSELPHGLWTRMMPHFGIACSEADREAMGEVAKYDAKNPGTTFSREAREERDRARQRMQPLAEQYLGDVYLRLELLRRDETGRSRT